DAAAGERTLRAGLARLPGEEKLALELAMLLTRRHQRDAARAVISSIVASAADRGYDGARYRFPARPDDVLAAAAAELAARAAGARRQLAAGLAVGGEPGEGGRR